MRGQPPLVSVRGGTGLTFPNQMVMVNSISIVCLRGGIYRVDLSQSNGDG